MLAFRMDCCSACCDARSSGREPDERPGEVGLEVGPAERQQVDDLTRAGGHRRIVEGQVSQAGLRPVRPIRTEVCHVAEQPLTADVLQGDRQGDRDGRTAWIGGVRGDVDRRPSARAVAGSRRRPRRFRPSRRSHCCTVCGHGAPPLTAPVIAASVAASGIRPCSPCRRRSDRSCEVAVVVAVDDLDGVLGSAQHRVHRRRDR